jgi:hypothetical protein
VKLFESLKRLFEPRARPPVETQPPRSEPTPPNVIPVAVVPVEDEIEAVAEVPEPAESLAAAPAPTLSPEPTLFEESTQEVVDVPSAASQPVGNALVLTLATPPATFTVAKAAATIGRGQENTIRLDDLSVSRRHARIAYKQGGYWLSDTGSMGGTWVDGTRLNAPYRIAPGQVIDIGLCRLTVSFAAGAAPADKKETTRKPRSEIAGQGRRAR